MADEDTQNELRKLRKQQEELRQIIVRLEKRLTEEKK
jgi:5-bromo-4-chloroindolyl phosphate hydrolysis protein